MDDDRVLQPPAPAMRERAEILRRWGVDYVMVDLRGQKDVAAGRSCSDPQPAASSTRDPPDVPSTLGRFAILRVRR